MKNGVYVTIQDLNNDEIIRSNSGVIKKILSQYNILELNYNMRMDIFKSERKKSVIHKILSRTPFFPIHCFWKITKSYLNINFLYIRMEIIDGFFINFLKKIKQLNKNILIIAEIPTYPYDEEFHKLKYLHVFIKNKISRRELHKYVDRIVTYSLDDFIFGIKTIKTVNGIDISAIPPVSDFKDDSSISLLTVANMSFWHGLDRLITGMYNYYNNNNNNDIIIKLDIVGIGEEFNKLQLIINKYNLDSYIKMHGYLTGNDLNEVFNKSDIAISSLGDHRKGLRVISALKTREYLARGLPIIASSKIDIIPDDYKYCFYISQDDTPVNINDIISFYKNIYLKNSRISIVNDIRNFAKSTCDINITFKPILDYLNKVTANNEKNIN